MLIRSRKYHFTLPCPHSFFLKTLVGFSRSFALFVTICFCKRTTFDFSVFHNLKPEQKRTNKNISIFVGNFMKWRLLVKRPSPASSHWGRTWSHIQAMAGTCPCHRNHFFWDKNFSWGYGYWRRGKIKDWEGNERRESPLEPKVDKGRQGQN